METGVLIGLWSATFPGVDKHFSTRVYGRTCGKRDPKNGQHIIFSDWSMDPAKTIQVHLYSGQLFRALSQAAFHLG